MYDDNIYSTQSPSGSYSPIPEEPKKTEKKMGGFHKVMVSVCMGLLFGVCAGLGFYAVAKTSGVLDAGTTAVSQQTVTDTTSGGTSVGSLSTDSATSTVTTLVTEVQSDITSVVEKMMPSMVSVVEYYTYTDNYYSMFGQSYSEEVSASGSGIIIAETDTEYLIVTNNHVVADEERLEVTFVDDTVVEANLKGTDVSKDLAIIAVQKDALSDSTKEAISVATLGDSDNLVLGETVIAIGNALGYGQSVTTGVISALNRDVTFQNSDGSTQTISLLQTDAAVNPGNSGGALLNMKGEVIGVVSAKYSDTEVEGMGYAIPMSQARDIINQLMEKGTATVEKDDKEEAEEPKGFGAYLGIAGVDLDSNTAYQYNMPTGVYVASVVEGSGSQAAGIEKGDVITAFQGKDILSMTELQEQIAKCHPGDTVKVSVAKANANFAITTYDVTLTEVIGN